MKDGGNLLMQLKELFVNIFKVIQFWIEAIHNNLNGYHYKCYILMKEEFTIIDAIINCALFLGIIITIRGNKEKIRAFRNLGLMLVALCSIYVVPSFLSGFYQGFLDGIMGC